MGDFSFSKRWQFVILALVKQLLRYCNFFRFSRWRLPPYWILEIPKNLLADGVCRAEAHQLAKFCQN